MSRYQDIRRRWRVSLRRSVPSLVYLLAHSGMFPVPPPYVSDAAAPDTRPASPDLALAPLTASERRAWRQLVRELSARPKLEPWQ